MGSQPDGPRPTHQLAQDTYRADPLPDFEVFQAAIRETATTLDRLVTEADR